MAQEKQQSGISLQTLLISALAAVAAAIVVPLFWERGTLIATAMTPVIVAVVSEALKKPVEVIKSVTPAPTRRSATGAAVRNPGFDPLPPDEGAEPPAVRDDDPFGLRAKPRVRHHWRLAVATGAIACVIAVVALTVSELVLGGPATREGGRTTIFRGDSSTPTPTPTATPGEQKATPTATPTATPQTRTAPQPTPSPTTTVTPQTQTAPQATPTPTP